MATLKWEAVGDGTGGPCADREEVLESALRLIGRGFAVMDGPGVAWGECGCRAGSACPSPGKHPRGGWGSRERRSLSADEARWVWGRGRVRGSGWIVPNLFVVAYLSDLVVADVDDWDGFRAQGLEVPDTLTALSGRGGRHLYYRRPWSRGDGWAPVPRLARSVLPGGTGEVRWVGVVAAPPSAHRSGTAYRWADWGADVAGAPDWLAAERPHRSRPGVVVPAGGGADAGWARMMRDAWLSDVAGLAALRPGADGRMQRPVRGFAVAARGGALVALGVLGADAAHAALMGAARSNGWVADAGDDEVDRQIRNGIAAGIEEERVDDDE